MICEASFLCTGFSNISLELLKRLHASGEYEIAELGTYAKQSDPRVAEIPWKFYGAQPEDHDKEGLKEYHKPHAQWGRQQNLGQFGAWAINRVLLDFKPDYVISHMDPWMSTVIADCPLRPFFRWIYMPCIDSTPQRMEWLKMYEGADYLMGYSDFAINVMKEQSPRIRAAGAKKLMPMPARPGVDMDIFKPLDKSVIREKWGLSKDLPILLTCMRNQQRKLFCEAIDSFADYKKKNAGNPIADKAVFLIHSSGYDAGQEYWQHILRLSTLKYLPYYYKDLHKHILHTYLCDNCHRRQIGFATQLLNARMMNGRHYMKCPCCGAHALRTPNTNKGFSREDMAEVFNLADAYVQVSIAGADEMPASEAKACGIPVLISTNAALAEKARIPLDFEGNKMTKKADGTPYTMHKGGIPIDIAYEFHEASTMQRRSYFSRRDLTEKLKVLQNPDKLKRLGAEAIEAIKDNCNYDKIASQWMYVFENLPMKDRDTTWDKPLTPQDFPDFSNLHIPNLNDEDFVDWCYTDILKSTIDNVGRQTWINDLAAGRPRQEIIKFFVETASNDKISDKLLFDSRQHAAHQNAMKELVGNGNVLPGIMVQ